jgi:SAM-dependent methyltransferase
MATALSGYGDGGAWAAGPGRVYALLAEAAVGMLPGDLSGVLGLDAGAGTGAATRALCRRGARVLVTDRSPAMLAAAPGQAFVADVRRLPLPDAAVDLAVAALVLSHLTDPETGLAELRRVTRPAGTVLVTAFSAGTNHPVKRAVDRVLARYGYRAPDWYAQLKALGELRVGDAAALAALAWEAGLVDVRVDELAVDLAPLDAAALAGWRLGMAQVTPFLAGLDRGRRDRLTVEATDAVSSCLPGDPLALLVLRSSRRA